MRLLLKPILVCLGILFWTYVHAQHEDSLRSRLAALLIEYQNNGMRDTDYLRSVDTLAPLLEKEDSLQQLLSTYRQIAFSNEKWGLYRAGYFTYLALNAYNLNRFGSAVYYSEKNNEERVKLGLFEKNGFSHSDLFALTVYANNRDYSRVFARYAVLRPTLLALPSLITAGKTSAEQVFVAVSLLQTVVYSAGKAGDTTRATEGVRLMGAMLAATSRWPEKYKDYLLLYDYLSHGTRYDYHRFLRHFDQARHFLEAAIRDARTKGFRAHLQTSYLENCYSEAVDFYFETHKPDSARFYLSLLAGPGGNGVRYSSLNPAFMADSKSRLLAGEGRYAEAYAQLRKVYQLRDSAFYSISSDKDNNLYALAEGENTHAELLRSEAKKRSAEQFNIILFFIITFLILGGLAGFLVYRSAQQRRLLNLRLQLARNFHDEIGPMLLYANILVKKEMEDRPSRNGDELKNQVALIMNAVRSIAHDLKSTRLSTISSFGKEMTVLLDKIRAAAHIDFSLQVGNGSRVLSHGQFTQLRTIVQELISNSIKHADCSKITLRIAAPGRMLTIHYSDNGKGIHLAPSSDVQSTGIRYSSGIQFPSSGIQSPSSGIGMQNMRERAAALKGNFQLNNFWPEGYFIDISIPLV